MADRQANFAYSQEQITKLVRAISLERLLPYLKVTRDDKWLAIQIYNQNTELSKELYGTLSVFEVLLRNVIHTAMTRAHSSDTWYFSLPLRDAELGDIREAEEGIGSGVNSTWLRQRAGEFIPQGTDPNFVVKPGRVIAALSFGFWVKLHSHSYDKNIWPVIEKYWQGSTRDTVHKTLSDLRVLRNRIAHHETLLKRDREKDYNDLLNAIETLSPTTREWAESESRFMEILKRPLPKRPKLVAAEPQATEVAAPPQ